MIKTYILMLKLIIVAVILSISTFCVAPRRNSNKIRITQDELTMVINMLGDRLQRSRYMEKNCVSFEYPGWEGYQTSRCSYTVTDEDGTVKNADVVMLNLTEAKLARWIITTCKKVKGELSEKDIERLITHIIGQSGGQFPVAGIVYEDILPADGVYEIFCFRNGVTVMIEGITHRGTEQPSRDEINLSIYGKVTKVFRYARVQSTTPEQYINNGGTVDVGNNEERKHAWMDVIRQLYQEAWDNDVNDLMIAWARENL